MNRLGCMLVLVLLPLGAATAQDEMSAGERRPPPTCGYAAAQAEELAERRRRTLEGLLELEQSIREQEVAAASFGPAFRKVRLMLLEEIVQLDPPAEAADPLSRAIAWLARHQDRTGRWGAGLEADALATAALFRSRSAGRLAELCRLRIQVHGSVDPGEDPVEPRVLSIVLWVRTLLDPDPFRTTELRARLSALRHEDGSWKNRERDDPLATRWALLALGRRVEPLPAPRTPEESFLAAQALRGEERAALRRATRAPLLATQRPDGSWAEGDDESVPARVRATALAVLCLAAP